MSEQLLTILKFVLIALVWLFFVRVLRTVWADLKRERAVAPPAPAQPPPVMTPAQPTGPRPNGAASQHLRLSVLEPPELRGRSFDVADELVVGRSSGCGVSVPEDNFVSNHHARFFTRENKLWIEDLGSTNGTYLNTHRLAQPAPVRNGDRLQVGRTVFEVSQ
ncbi:MAG: FHA domain-containing protein [Acidimicrobiales bacterium]|nr:FHA domain-containing protein [Acidimicrobiales bacterium]MBO0893887.1 FHA domain-containing protein [Acidimicrobiales bacterium]